MSSQNTREYRTAVIESHYQRIEIQVPKIYASEKMFTDNGQERFIKIPRYLWEGDNPMIRKIGAGPLGLFIALLSYMDKTRLAWPSNDTLSKMARLSVRTVIRHLKVLEKHGLIVKVPKCEGIGGRGATNCYFINEPIKIADCPFKSGPRKLIWQEEPQPDSSESRPEPLQDFTATECHGIKKGDKMSQYPDRNYDKTDTKLRQMANENYDILSHEYRLINNINKTTTTTTKPEKSGGGSGCYKFTDDERVATLMEKFLTLYNGPPDSVTKKLTKQVARSLTLYRQEDIEAIIEQYAIVADHWGLIDFHLELTCKKLSDIQAEIEQLEKSRYETERRQKEAIARWQQIEAGLVDISDLPMVPELERKINLISGGVLSRVKLPKIFIQRYARYFTKSEICELRQLAGAGEYQEKGGLSFQEHFVIIAEKHLAEKKNRLNFLAQGKMKASDNCVSGRNNSKTSKRRTAAAFAVA